MFESIDRYVITSSRKIDFAGEGHWIWTREKGNQAIALAKHIELAILQQKELKNEEFAYTITVLDILSGTTVECYRG